MENGNTEYQEIQQRKMRDENILKSVREANAHYMPQEYSEEQIIEAQKQLPKKEINELYANKIVPTYNGILYWVYYAFSIVIIPVLYCLQDGIKKGIAVVAWGLLVVVLFVMHLSEKKYQRDMKKESESLKKLNRLSNDTSAACYMLTSFGYISEFLPPLHFLFIYLLLIAIPAIVLFVKPRKD